MLRRADEGKPDLNSHTYLVYTASSLWENLPQVLLGGVIFCLISAPAFVLALLELRWLSLAIALISVAPAWTVLLAFEAQWVQGRSIGVAQLPMLFRRTWIRSARLGLAAASPSLIVVGAIQLLAQPQSALALVVGLVGGFAGLLVALVVILYAFPLVALYDFSTPVALHDSFVLSARHIANTLGLTAMAMLMALAAFYVSPGLIFIWPPVFALFVANHCWLVMQDEMGAHN